MEMEMNIEDEIETEIDVVYSGELDSEINLFQYPLVPKENLNSSSINSITINRQNFLMKIDKNLDKRTLNQLAPKVSPTHTLIGERIEANTNLLVGVFRDNVFYLTPIANTYQFRHDFSKSDGANEVINTKKKVDRRDYRNSNNNALVKNEKEEIVYSPLMIFNSNSIESCSMIEKITSVANRHPFHPDKVKFLSKEGYYALLLKYINDTSIIDELNEKAIPTDHTIEDTIFRTNKKNKGALLGLSINKPKQVDNHNDDKMDIDDDNSESNKNKQQLRVQQHNKEQRHGDSVILNTVQALFGKKDCLNYDKLFDDIKEKLRIDSNPLDQISKIEAEIKDICFITNNRTCFLKTKGDDEETNTIRLKLLEFLSLNHDSGVKRNKITLFLKENNISFKSNTVTSILNSIGKKGKNELWALKEFS